ncbi:MAG: 30S ribosomal protein S4 [Thermodesulfobacteriota bacterium]
MARYTGPKCRICRRLNLSVCGSLRCALQRRESPPGMHPRGARKMSDFAKQLAEKQKVKYTYWVGERQFKNYALAAFRQKGDSGANLLRLLERRLDSVVYRLGFAPTLPAARQLVAHGHILVNGQRVDRPSYSVRKGEVVSLTEKSRKMKIVEEGLVRAMTRPRVPYIELDRERLAGTLVELPRREEISIPVDDRLVVEYFSRKI